MHAKDSHEGLPSCQGYRAVSDPLAGKPAAAGAAAPAEPVAAPVQQSVLVAVTNNREVDGKEIDYLRNEAEYQAGELPDGDWKIEEVDMMDAIFETVEE